MELNITHMVNEHLEAYSNSVAKSGLEDIGRVTWSNALECDLNFVTSENRDDLRDHIREFGAWSTEEIDAWTDNELNALVVQFISGDLQEYLDFKSRSAKEFDEWNENCGGRIYECDIKDHSEFGELFYYIGI